MSIFDKMQTSLSLAAVPSSVHFVCRSSDRASPVIASKDTPYLGLRFSIWKPKMVSIYMLMVLEANKAPGDEAKPYFSVHLWMVSVYLGHWNFMNIGGLEKFLSFCFPKHHLNKTFVHSFFPQIKSWLYKHFHKLNANLHLNKRYIFRFSTLLGDEPTRK